MINRYIIGPKFYEGTLTGEAYLEFLQGEFPGFLENVPLNIRANTYFQHDGVPPHNSRIVVAYLNPIFPNKWIGIYGPIRWPARTPDLKPLDYFLWGYLKDRVYQTPPADLVDLKNIIRNKCEDLNAKLLKSVTFRELLHRAECCIESNGQRFEYFL